MLYNIHINKLATRIISKNFEVHNSCLNQTLQSQIKTVIPMEESANCNWVNVIRKLFWGLSSLLNLSHMLLDIVTIQSLLQLHRKF